MRRIGRDPVKDKKEDLVYGILFFFLCSFVIKIVFGTLTGSKTLLVAGMFAFLGVFLSAITLLRIHIAHASERNVQSDFNQEKLEFMVVAGVSLVIAISMGTVLFSIVHLTFYHRLYPPELLGAWVAAFLACANWVTTHYLSKKIHLLKETDEKRVLFLFRSDFILSMMVVIVIMVSRSGFYALDYLFAILKAIFIMVYSVYFLYQSFHGLMDASCDAVTLHKISKAIKKADPRVVISALKVNVSGSALDIMATIGMDRTTTMKEAKVVVEKIDRSLNSNLASPFKAYVGFTGKRTGG